MDDTVKSFVCAEQNIPPDRDVDRLPSAMSAERERGAELVEVGNLRHVRQILGRRAVHGLHEVHRPNEPHVVLCSLLPFPWMDVEAASPGKHALDPKTGRQDVNDGKRV